MNSASLLYLLDFLMLTEEEKRGLQTPLCRTPVSDLLQFAAQFLPTTLYPSALSNTLLFGMHPMLTLTAPSADALPDSSADTVGASADSQSADTKTDDEVADEWDDDDVAQASSVDSQPSLSSSNGDAASIGYPPMPATAQHVSDVQDRILRGSSVNEDLLSPIQADTVDVGHGGETAVDPGMIASRFTESTPDVFPDVSDLRECLQTEHVVETPRSVTQRRSRIVARFSLVQQHSEYAPDSS